MPDSISVVARDLQLKPGQVRAVEKLLGDGATVPFIARYRKEATGSLDEVQIRAVRDQLAAIVELDKRRESMVASLQERELLTDELQRSLSAATSLTELEDLYLPWRPKRRTRAEMARERGLEPLAKLLRQQQRETDPRRAAKAYIDAQREVTSVKEALAGARDIIAEWLSEDATLRQVLRRLFTREAMLTARVVKSKQQEGQKFRDYFDWQEKAQKAPSHRLLAILRGEHEGVLRVSVRPPEERAVGATVRYAVQRESRAGEQVTQAAEDAWKRLLAPSLENELRRELKAEADAEAIRVFAENVRELLMAPPLGRVPVLAIDPGFRTGCKVVCLSAEGTLLHDTVIFPHEKGRREEAAKTVARLCRQYEIRAIAIGNGTAGRETEAFVRELELAAEVAMVNESGASIYSASEVAREEFPDHDLTVRGAVSIGRRLMDPLAELVKLDPRSIGVGQYQHDVDQGQLQQALDDVVVSCVNAVGVEVNTASRQLLMAVSGLGERLAANVVEYREENGPFGSRAELKKVPRLGPKAFEQAAGFLRVSGACNPLDASAVHPERYGLVRQMAADQQVTVQTLMADAASRQRIELARYVDEDVGLPTLRDIVAELAKPGRDPREAFSAFRFADSVHAIGDLVPGMKLPGIVTNVTRFGAFVDVGVHQDGLVHISQLADYFVRDPADVVRVQQQVQVTVLEVDLDRQRISLSLKE